MKQFRPVYGDVLRIAAPISFSLAIPQISFVANTLFVAHLGAEALSVVGMVGVYYLLLTWMGYGLSNGLLVLLSRKAGENDIAGFGQIFRNGFSVALVFLLSLLLLSYTFGASFYRNTMAHPELAEDTIQFLFYRLPGLPFLILNQLMNIFLISTGRTAWLLVGSILGNAVNIFMDYVLIFGNFGFPEMGVNGAAVGSVLGELVYFISILSLIFHKNWIKEYQLWGGFCWDKLWIKKIVTTSSPLVFQYIFSIGGWQLFFFYMEHLGKEEVAATHIIRNALGVIGIGSWALASTSNTLAGNLLGQGKSEKVLLGIRKVMLVGLFYGILTSLFLFIFKDTLLPYFSTEPEVVQLVKDGLKVIYFSSALLCVATVLFNATIGIGATKSSMYFEVSAVVLYMIYLSLVFNYFKGDFFWAWTSDLVYWAFLLVSTAIFLLRKKWIVRIQR